jgi:26S proteasome regulatory subunit N12
MLDLDSLPPLLSSAPNAAEERAIARQVLEYAVILSVALQDKILFQKNMSALRPYYTQLGP